MMIPTQEKEHKKKCLLPDGAGSPSPAPRQARLAVVQGRGESRDRKRPVGQRKRKQKNRRKQQQQQRFLAEQDLAQTTTEVPNLILEDVDDSDNDFSDIPPATNLPLGALGRLGVAASNRNTRRFQGFASQPHVGQSRSIKSSGARTSYSC